MYAADNYRILLGGIGGDSHSIGLTILRQALSMNGYHVHSIGIQNQLKDFFVLAPHYNVVMISTMDGHARYYLSRFPEMIKQYNIEDTRWYLGGNLHIGDGQGYERYFLEMGFHRVFVKFIEIKRVLEVLQQDLRVMVPKRDLQTVQEQLSSRSHVSNPFVALSDEALESEEFIRMRREVLELWKTGSQARNLNENAAFLGLQPSFARQHMLVRQGKQQILLQPRSGVADIEKQIAMLKTFKELGVRTLSFQVDSLTRNGSYREAEEALRQSQLAETSILNGLPAINYGVPALRRMVAEVKGSLQTRHSARDPRLLAEISYAGGMTGFEGGCIGYNLPYYKDYPLDEAIKIWQYVDRLTGLYYERYGIVLDREFFGVLTGTLIPPSLAIVANILEAILAVKQGVKSISLGYAEQGNRIQDFAAVYMLRQMATEVLQNIGYSDIQINTVFHQYMAAFPLEMPRAEELIFHSAATGKLSGADRMIVKTPVEALKIPSLVENVRGIGLAYEGVVSAKEEGINRRRVRAECELIRREVEAILASIVFCDPKNIAAGIIQGLQKGLIDIPFAPSLYNRGAVITARDCEGAVRFLSPGNLPFDEELRAFHREKMQDRLHAEGVFSEKQGYLLVERDILRVAQGDYDHWPLFG